MLSVIPNDTLFSDQWGLNNSNNVDIDAPEAWGITTGSSSVIVAEIEMSGVQVNHPDLSAKIVDPWNFDTGTSTFSPTTGHGTNITGIIGASTNNGTGIAGVDWGGPVMPIEASHISDLPAAVNYAVANGARVISMSIGYSEAQAALSGDSLCLAIEAAASHGVVVVAAAGNGGLSGYTSDPGQDLAAMNPTEAAPAFRMVPGVTNLITVAAVDSSGNLASWSNYGATSVDLGAPGVSITTTDLTTYNNGYGNGYIGNYASGTSFAAPFVAGVVGLVASQHPEYSALQLVQAVTQNTKPLASLNGKTITGGMVDAYNALLAGCPAPTASATQASPTTENLVVNENYGGGDPGLTYTWTVTNKPSGAATPAFSASNGTNSGKSTTATFYAAGSYTLQAKVANGDGYSYTLTVPVTVSQTATTVTVSPGIATVADMGTQNFAATALDQFGASISSPSVSWSVQAGGVGGTVNQSGTYTAPNSGAGTDTVKAASGNAAGTATVTVTSSSGSGIQVNLASYATAVGITTPGSNVKGSIDSSSESLSSQALATASNWTSQQAHVWNGQTFNLPANTNDIVPMGGNSIPIPQGSYTALDVLALSAGYNPSQAGVFTLFYSDGSSDQYTQGISEWTTGYTGVGGTTAPGESIAATMSQHDTWNGTQDVLTTGSGNTVYVYGYVIPVDPSRTLQTISLYNNANMKLLAVNAVDTPPYVQFPVNCAGMSQDSN